MFEAVTHDIHISVQPEYIPEQSNPSSSYFFFSYSVRIHNSSRRTVQLISRHWVIKDAFGKVEEVTGSGVIGVQPVLKPGQTFNYSSFCPLGTPTGYMKGAYTMVDADGEQLVVQIPQFTLCEPNHYH
jgi:ApaG protein